ncbi:MAG: peptide chain release factor N(5)-glutamine methyltransferase, partial [Clostridia bacterium]
LIPRPETEELAEKAIATVNSILGSVTTTDSVLASDCSLKTVNVLDLCTGSGAIAIALAKKTAAKVTATDISAAAVEVAKANALTAGVAVTFEVGDLFGAVGKEKFDVIVSNPPYIKTADIAGLDKKVKDFEPMLALDGGSDGLDFYKRIASE